jgi:hypothetical protein
LTRVAPHQFSSFRGPRADQAWPKAAADAPIVPTLRWISRSGCSRSRPRPRSRAGPWTMSLVGTELGP